MITINTQTFTGPLDGVVTNTLRTLDTNPMANAVGIDLFAMVGPRTYVDTKERNKYAGAETFFREFTGTLIVCLSASYFARGIAKIANKFVNPDIKINPNSWFSDESLKFLQSTRNGADNTRQYVSDILSSMSGIDGRNTKKFKDIDWDKVEWVDEKKWSAYKWDNKNFKNINLKDKNSIISAIEELIENKSISLKDTKKMQSILEVRITNALGADKIMVQNADQKLSTSVHNILRDTIDLGRDVFTNKNINSDEAIKKLLKINKLKSIGALALASILGLTNQWLNRKITEKRTGTKGFVGDADYRTKVKDKASTKDSSRSLLVLKILASLGMAFMAAVVMKVKSPKDFLKKLEFTGPVNSGNVIKTVYASTLIGRFLASDSKDELRETVTRDYLGFLNWLVFGGFAAKGVANMLDKDKKVLFNISKKGKGLKHWLNDLSLKSHNEIAAKGKLFAKKNMWKLNLAHASGLAYSTVALGILLPKLNILITNKKQKRKPVQQFEKLSFEGFLNASDNISKIA